MERLSVGSTLAFCLTSSGCLEAKAAVCAAGTRVGAAKRWETKPLRPDCPDDIEGTRGHGEGDLAPSGSRLSPFSLSRDDRNPNESESFRQTGSRP